VNDYQHSIVGFDEFMKVQAEHAYVSVVIRIVFKLINFGLSCGLASLHSTMTFNKKKTISNGRVHGSRKCLR